MKNKKVISGALLVVILVATVGGIWVWRNNQSSGAQQSSTTIRVGSKDFTENLVIAETYALALENNGCTVERVSSISNSLIHNSIANDEIDLYPEYIGTGLLSVLGEDMETDPEKVYKTIKKEYGEQFNLTWLDYASANGSQGLVIRTEVANSLSIKTVSDLQAHASELRFTSQGEFDEREDGLPGLGKTYGISNWQSSKVYDNSLKYSVLEDDEADVTPTYTTEGQLVNTDEFTLLGDGKQFWPPYNLAPVVRDNTLDDNPDTEAILSNISAKLDTEAVTELSVKVDVDGQEYTDVAREYYDSIKG